MRRLSSIEAIAATVLIVGALAVAPGRAGEVAAEPHSPGPEAPAVPAELRDLREELSGRVASGELPSVAIGVLRSGEVVWREAFGWADRENGIPATPAMPYGLASLGKSITATAVLSLVQRGALSPDAPVAPWLAPAILRRGGTGEPAPALLRHVLQMTAAVPHGNYTYDHPEDAAAITSEQLVRNRGVAVFAPGEFVEYSNFTYGLLERVLERATGLPYADAVRREVFEPLGMTTAFVAEGTAPEGSVARYDDEGGRLPNRYPRPRSSRAMNASVDDLLRYAAFHLGHGDGSGAAPILSPATLRRAHLERPDLPGGRISLGGWGSFDLPSGELVLLSNGRDRGVQSTLAMRPAHDLAVVVLANVDGDVTDDLAFRTLDALVPGFLDGFAAVVEAFQQWSTAAAPPEAIVGSWSGSVDTAQGPVPLVLDFGTAELVAGTSVEGDSVMGDSVTVRLGEGAAQRLADVGWEEGLFTGRFEGRIVLEEEPPAGAHRLDLGLRLVDGALSGYVMAIFTNDRGSFALPTFARLERDRRRQGQAGQ